MDDRRRLDRSARGRGRVLVRRSPEAARPRHLRARHRQLSGLPALDLESRRGDRPDHRGARGARGAHRLQATRGYDRARGAQCRVHFVDHCFVIWRGIDLSCGCFGAAEEASSVGWPMLLRDLGLMLAIAAAYLPPERKSA